MVLVWFLLYFPRGDGAGGNYDARVDLLQQELAKLQAEAMRFGGEITYLSDGEIAEMQKTTGHGRAWEYWARRAGV